MFAIEALVAQPAVEAKRTAWPYAQASMVLLTNSVPLSTLIAYGFARRSRMRLSAAATFTTATKRPSA